MRLLFRLLSISLPALAQPSVSAIAFTESRQPVRAFSALGETSLPSLRVQVDVPNPEKAEKKERGDVLIIYNPETGHYLWRYRAFRSVTTRIVPSSRQHPAA
jgi:hypothetical protein